MTHKTQKLVVDGCAVDVDINMVPVVIWLNQFPSVKTLFCCEGDDDKQYSSHCLFRCNDSNDLKQIIKSLGVSLNKNGDKFVFGECTVDVFEGDFRYNLEFALKYAFLPWSRLIQAKLDKIDIDEQSFIPIQIDIQWPEA